jgi:hypothetical protein
MPQNELAQTYIRKRRVHANNNVNAGVTNNLLKMRGIDGAPAHILSADTKVIAIGANGGGRALILGNN